MSDLLQLYVVFVGNMFTYYATNKTASKVTFSLPLEPLCLSLSLSVYLFCNRVSQGTCTIQYESLADSHLVSYKRIFP